MKSKFILQFPTKQDEMECMINPYHLEPAVTIAMSEENVPICLVCDESKNTFLIATYEPDGKFKFFYPNNDKRTTVSLVLHKNLTAWIRDDDWDEPLEQVIEDEAISDGDLFQHTFNSAEEADAYVLGVDDVMNALYSDDEYCFVDEDMYSKIKNAIHNGLQG